jgi:hypothetical protein
MIYLHENNVVYIDHKPEHVYWDGHSLRLIDFNVSQTIDALSQTEKESLKRTDMRHFMAGVLYTVFTGLDFKMQSPGSRVIANPSDPTAVTSKFAGVTHLDFGMEPELLTPLVRLIQHTYSLEAQTTAAEFLTELRRCAALAGLDGPSPQVKEHDRRARLEVQAGLAKLHDAQRLLEEARQHFLNATSHQPSDQDCLRLYRQSSEFYAQRLLP